MKHSLLAFATGVAGIAISLSCSPAFAAKACEELKSEIATKLDGKGIKGYTLEIVPADQTGDKKVVGTCEGGAKKIVYSKQ